MDDPTERLISPAFIAITLSTFAYFMTLGALLPLSSGLLMSQRRYMWILFPAFVLLARWGERSGVDRTLQAVFAPGLGLCMALFANWYWVG